MKRIRDRQRYRRHQRSRHRAVLRQRARVAFQSARAGAAPSETPVRLPAIRPRDYYTVAPDPNFCLLANPEPTIQFFNRLLENLRRRRNTWVELHDVVQIDFDAILVLLSIMVRFRVAGVGFNGDIPDDPHAAARIRHSGFFESLYRNFANQNAYHLKTSNKIRTDANRCVDSALTAELIADAARTVWNAPHRCQGVQRVLIELMQNTNNHASPLNPGEKHWWLSVTQDRGERRAHFVFVDLGVGIFNSLDAKPPSNKWYGWRDKLRALFSRPDNAGMLDLILKGELHKTVTHQSYRGKGLPGVRQAFERNWLSNLKIVSNDVFADVATDSVRSLGETFSGTLVSWDLDASNHFTEDFNGTSRS